MISKRALSWCYVVVIGVLLPTCVFSHIVYPLVEPEFSFFLLLHVLNGMLRFSGYSEGGVRLAMFVNAEWRWNSGEIRWGGRFVVDLGFRKHLFLITHVFERNHLISLRRPPIDPRQWGHLKHKNLILCFRQFWKSDGRTCGRVGGRAGSVVLLSHRNRSYSASMLHLRSALP